MNIFSVKRRFSFLLVAALMSGFVSVISAPIANAAAADVEVEANAAAGTAASSHATGSGASQGLISGAGAKNGAGTATMFANGKLALDVTAPTTITKFSVLTITGGTFVSAASGTITSDTIVGGAAGARFGVLAVPTAAGTNMVIRSFNDATAATASTGGTANVVLTVTVKPALVLGANGAAVTASATAPVSFGITGTPVETMNAQTAVMYDSGELSIAASRGTTAGTKYSVVTVSGGTVTSTAGSPTLTGLNTVGHNGEFGLTVKPNAAGTLLVVTFYDDATAATSTSGGTVTDKITVTVTTAASAGTFSAANSFVNLHTAAASGAITSNADTANANLVANGGAGYIRFSLNDANNLSMSTSTVISASATGGAVVSLNGTTFSTAISGTYGGTYGTVYVAQGVANTAATTTVTISVNGATWATKSLTIVGDVNKIELSDASRLKRSASNTGAFYLTVTDAAGNLINGITPSVTAGSINASVISVTPVITASSLPTGQTAECSATRGTSTITYTYTNARNQLITSNALPVVCAGSPYTYTASLDATSYAQGGIAELTISAKDSQGNAVSDYHTLGSVSAASISITCGSQLTAVTAPAYTDTFTNGAAKYKFTVGTTAGSYNCVVDLKDYNDATTPQAAITVPYSIKGDGGVSNAEVLAAIVKLIASINKQIKALQKSLRR